MLIVVQGLLTGSFSSTTSTSTTSSSQDSEDSIFRSAMTRSQSTSTKARRDPLRSRKTECRMRNEDTDKARTDPLRNILGWLENLTENLVDDKVRSSRNTPASSSRGLEAVAPKEVVLGKPSVDSHLPKDRHCEIRKKTKISRAPYRKRTGRAIPRSERFGV